MPRLDITRAGMPGTRMTAGQNFTFDAGDPANQHRYRFTGKEALIVRNTSGTTAYNLTVHSTPDALGRVGNVVHSIPANGFAVFGPVSEGQGWVQSDGYVNVDVQNAALTLAILLVP